MKVLAVGPASSGTRYLARLLAAGGAEVVHRSQPHGPDWVDVAALLDDFDAVVVVVRGRLAQLRSLLAAGHLRAAGGEVTVAGAARWRREALSWIAPVLGDERVFVVTYESLAERAERADLLETLGLDQRGADAEEMRPQNVKHYGG